MSNCRSSCRLSRSDGISGKNYCEWLDFFFYLIWCRKKKDWFVSAGWGAAAAVWRQYRFESTIVATSLWKNWAIRCNCLRKLVGCTKKKNFFSSSVPSCFYQAIHVLAVIIVPIQAIAFSRIGVDCVISGSDPVLKAAQANSRRIAGVALVGTFLRKGEKRERKLIQ